MVRVSVTSGRHIVCVIAAGVRLGCRGVTVAVPSVGPLFTHGLTMPHDCTAAVVSSAAGNVVMTAAHCVRGTGAGAVFVPGYDKGAAPYGSWVVQHAYLAPSWVSSSDPRADYAFLVVAPSPTNAVQRSVQSAVGGGNPLGSAPSTYQPVTLVGYVYGRNDEPVICTGRVYHTSGYPSVYCPGFASGTSGSPWLGSFNATTRTGTITAVIGGLYHGGCTDDVSYSSPLTAATTAVYDRAVSGGAADTAPPPQPSGC